MTFGNHTPKHYFPRYLSLRAAARLPRCTCGVYFGGEAIPYSARRLLRAKEHTALARYRLKPPSSAALLAIPAPGTGQGAS